MPPAKKPDSSANASCTCGPLEQIDGDQEIPIGTPSQDVLSEIMLLCDDTTGVFFFRYEGSLYRRVIETD